MHQGERTYLHTLGHPVLRRGDGTVVDGLRRKDLALLAYLCVEGDRPFSRAHLAALLWGESAEDRARHSLTQALRRASASVGRGALAMERDTVRWTGAAACDAQLLLESDARLDELLSIYEGPFLEGFEAGFGSDEFSAWADARRAELRRAAVRWLDRAGERAEREKDWALAQRIGERSVQIDRVWEGGHRRVMRALLERGERNLALRHYREFARWLTYEVGGHPDPETAALADLIRASATWAAPPPAPATRPPASESAEAPAERFDADEITRVNTSSDPVPPRGDWGTADPVRGADAPLDAPAAPANPPETPASDASLPPQPAPRETRETAVPREPHEYAEYAESSESHESRELAGGWQPQLAEAPRMPAEPRKQARRRVLALAVAAALLAVLAGGPWLARLGPAAAGGAQATVARGEVIRAHGDATAYLVFGNTLYAFPDATTLERCLGGWPRVRVVRALPARPRRTLPSVRAHPWLGGRAAVTGGDPAPLTQYVAVGCVLSPIPDTLTFRAIFGHTEWGRSAREPDTLLWDMPRTHLADPFPVRPAGTLIQGAGDSIRWVAYHGGALSVRSDAVLATYCRTRAEVHRVPDAEFRYYQSRADLPPAAAPCRRKKPRRTADDPARGSWACLSLCDVRRGKRLRELLLTLAASCRLSGFP
jgi:DNA-binding SARP family transcriptional activator